MNLAQDPINLIYAIIYNAHGATTVQYENRCILMQLFINTTTIFEMRFGKMWDKSKLKGKFL